MSKRVGNFNVYVYKLLREKLHGEEDPDHGFTGDATMMINNVIKNVVSRLMKAANLIVNAKTPPSKILSLRHVRGAFDMVFDGSLESQEIKEFANQAVDDFVESSKDKSERVARHERAGLYFSVSRIESLMLKFSVTKSKSRESAVFVAAVVEDVVRRILEDAKELANEKNKVRLTVKNICNVIHNSKYLKSLFHNCILGGSLYINEYSTIDDPEEAAEEEGSE